MSAIASFIKMPKTALEGLREAAVPQKRLFGASRDPFHDYLGAHGQNVADYRWPGDVLATLLVYLEEERQINLMDSEFDELSTFLSESRKTTYFIFTDGHQRSFVSRLAEDFSGQTLCDFYNEFNGSTDAEAGKPMLDGIRAIRESLSQLDESSVIVLGIG